jgi:hypothetical protein
MTKNNSCPKCGNLLVEMKRYPYRREDGFEYERLEYTCSFDGTRVPINDPSLSAAEERLAEFRVNYENNLRAKVKDWHDLANQRLNVSDTEKLELEEKIRAVEESLASSKQHLENEKSRLMSHLNKNTEDLLRLESGAKDSLTEVETKGLELYEGRNKKELLRIESLLAIIAFMNKTGT